MINVTFHFITLVSVFSSCSRMCAREWLCACVLVYVWISQMAWIVCFTALKHKIYVLPYAVAVILRCSSKSHWFRSTTEKYFFLQMIKKWNSALLRMFQFGCKFCSSRRKCMDLRLSTDRVSEYLICYVSILYERIARVLFCRRRRCRRQWRLRLRVWGVRKGRRAAKRKKKK